MSTRRAAFDPSRLNDLEEILPPPHGDPPPLPPTTATSASPKTSNSLIPRAFEEPDTQGGASARPARGRGGRRAASTPNEPEVSPNAVTLAVRIPRPLYETVIDELLAGGAERPSYAQVVGWTCEDHPEAVLAELMWVSRTDARVPRGRRKAAESVALTLRFQPKELEPLEQVIRQASGSRGAQVTKTAAVIAAFSVAVKSGIESAAGPT